MQEVPTQPNIAAVFHAMTRSIHGVADSVAGSEQTVKPQWRVLTTQTVIFFALTHQQHVDCLKR